MSAVSVRNVRKHFGSTEVLHGIDLDVAESSVTAILGPSGCGKTTLLRIIAGFTSPDSGTVTINRTLVCGNGRPVPPQRRRVGYVAQEGALFPHLRVAENVTFGLDRSLRRDRARVAELLEMVGLASGLIDRYPHELSGGQQQRVALARALAPDPALVLLDEPFSSLDASLRESTRRAVSQALRSTSTTAILVTHDQDEALSMADQVAVMRDGRLVQRGDPRSIYRFPADVGVASFVGDAMILAGTLRGGRLHTALGEIPTASSHPDGPAQGLIRPEQLLLDSGTGVSAQVTGINFYGHDATVRLGLASGEDLLARVAGHRVPEVGEMVTVSIDTPIVLIEDLSA